MNLTGKTISHYKILEKLGEGGMGVVYKAEDTKLERTVAIKFLPRHIASNAEERKRFEIEAKAAASLNHPNIATIHAIEEHDEEIFIVMEYIEGKELKDVIKSSGFSNPQGLEMAIHYATQIAEGLQTAHEKGVLHRDIKSANIMVTDKGQIKIMDFGLAKILGDAQVTKIGTTLGTTAFMSPEQTRAEDIDHRTDIWSFGVVLYEMLTGRLPFTGDYEQAVAYSILNEEQQPITDLRNDVSEKLAQIIGKTLEKRPDVRYQKMEELIADIKGCLVQLVPENVKPSHTEIEHNLPNPGTSFIGRKQEIDKIKDLQQQHRLVTLYGPGGSGKTRLALEVARKSLTHYPDGVFFFDLAPLKNPDMVSDTFAEVLKIKQEKDQTLEESIAGKIAHKNMLLVVDNCEHLIDKCAALIKDLLDNTEKPRFIITSREVLNIKMELKYYLPALRVPERLIKVSEIDNYESLLLFRDRAQMNNPDFMLDEATVGPVVSICQHLEGMPLALELAAARMNIMDADTIFKRLQNQFKLLRSSNRSEVPRQQTIRATLDWSHDLLTEDEKLLLYRLSIFAGDFDLDGVEQICSYDPLYEEDIIELLTHLADKSLVVMVEKGGKRRYRLLELMKEYGKEKLGEADAQQLKKTYYDFFLKKAKQSQAEKYEHSLKWIGWLGSEHDNIEGALEILNSSTSKQLELACYIGWYWATGANQLVGQKYLTTGLENYPKENVLSGRALCWQGYIEAWWGDLQSGMNKLRKGNALLRTNNAQLDLIETLQPQAMLEMFAGNYDSTDKLLKEGLQIAESLEDPWLILHYKTWIGGSLTNQLKADEAEPLVIQNLQDSRKMHALHDLDFNLHFYADLPMIREDYKEAEIRYLAGTQAGLKHGDLNIAIYDLMGVGMCLCGQGRYQKGLKLFGASVAKYEAIGASQVQNFFWNKLIERTVGKTIEEIGQDKANELIAEGRLMKFEDAIEYASKLNER